jgi:hypothetical protein
VVIAPAGGGHVFAQRRRVEAACLGDAEQPQGRLEFSAQDRQHVGRSLRPARGEPVQRCAAEQHRLGAERHRLGDVAAAAHPAVDEDGELAARRVDDRGQALERARCALELAAAVVADDDAVGAVRHCGARVGRVEDALDDERPVPVPAHPGQVGPGERHVHLPAHRRGVAAEVGREAGAPREVDELRRAALAQHAQAPARMGDDVAEQSRRPRHRHAETVAHVVVALAVDHGVDGEHQRVETGRLGARHHVLGDAALALHVELQPELAVARRAHVLEQRGRGGGEHEGHPGVARRLREHLLGTRPVEAVEPGRPDQRRHRLAAAEQLDAGVDFGDVLQRARAEQQGLERGAVARQGAAVLGAALEVVEGEARQAPPGECPIVLDRGQHR